MEIDNSKLLFHSTQIENFEKFSISLFFCLMIEINSVLRGLPFKIANPRRVSVFMLAFLLAYIRRPNTVFRLFCILSWVFTPHVCGPFFGFPPAGTKCWIAGSLWIFNGGELPVAGVVSKGIPRCWVPNVKPQSWVEIVAGGNWEVQKAPWKWATKLTAVFLAVDLVDHYFLNLRLIRHRWTVDEVLFCIFFLRDSRISL